ncbi:MAG: poly-gamma-glutamate biosynthesis protein PgsC/CapC, partial [Burkholderiaceae bacterium]|nr:poly-gamma-glutamate biosynthesis protein PgsC/CapC [Burkholderiaceae bacterium]
MMLPIFPAQALDSSVLTTVWIGLCVITFFNLRFGTTVAGLVVPGYLVPLLLVKPTSVAVIWTEAVVTYLLARLLADYLMRRTGSCTMFGRDRFFALLLISVLVRTVFDGFLLPWAGSWLSANGVAFDYHNNLYSFGLVIIALTANQMWNAGMVRGIGVFVLYVGLTFAIVRGLLIPYTNFDIAGLGFLYEGLATDILASPKAYLILLSTAFIASRMNLVYGWEFSGILIPALLALQWFQPTKLLISLVEAGIIFSIGHAALQLPMFRRMNMEGSRLMLLFFTCGYLYKLALGYALELFAPSIKASDYFAFGYLLSTLIAVKMHQKQITWQITRTTVQTSVMGLALASVAGYALVLLVPPHAASAAAQPGVLQARAPSAATLAQALTDRKRHFYESDRSPVALQYSAPQLQQFGDGVRALLRYRDDPRPALLGSGAQSLDRGGFVVERVRDWLVVRDRDARRGSGLYAINLHPRDRLAVEVPAPIDEPGVFEAAAQLVQADGHATFASAGTRRDLQPNGDANVLRNAELPFAIFHAAAGAEGVLQVRGQTSKLGEDPPAQLWVQREMPGGVDPARLARFTGPVNTRFGRRPSVNPLRDASTAPLAELLLGRPARLRLIARALQSTRATRIDQIQRVDGFLYAWLVQRRDAIASAGSGRYQPPALGDLLYLQAEVIEPLQTLASTWRVRRDED